MELLIENAVRSSIVLAPALLAAAMLRRQSAAVRHWILAAAVVGALLAPALQLLLPSWSLPPVRMPAAIGVAALSAPIEPDTAPAIDAVGRELVPATAGSALAQWVMAAWAAGAAMVLLNLGAGLASPRLADRARRGRVTRPVV